MLLRNNPFILSYFDQKIRFRLVKSYMHSIGKVLDVGCGSGTFGQFLESKGYDVLYLDIDKNLLKTIRNRDRLIASAMNLPLRNDTFNFVTSIDVLEHVPSRFKFLSELWRVCKSQMIFTFSQVHHNNPIRSGILIYEKLLKITKTSSVKWYNEHNALSLLTFNEVSECLNKLNITNYEKQEYQGLLNLFFLGSARIISTFKLIDLMIYLILRVIDIPPYYSILICAHEDLDEREVI